MPTEQMKHGFLNRNLGNTTTRLTGSLGGMLYLT